MRKKERKKNTALRGGAREEKCRNGDDYWKKESSFDRVKWCEKWNFYTEKLK